MSEQLRKHLRQYRHNDGEGFVFGYQKEGTEREFAALQAENAALKAALLNIAQWPNSEMHGIDEMKKYAKRELEKVNDE